MNVLSLWSKLQKLPFGDWVFSRLLEFQVPHASAIGADIVSLKAGTASSVLRDRRKVRNHLKSIHAAALVHLGEMTGNLALSSLQPNNGRWIVKDMRVEYMKKARGEMRAQCSLEDLDWTESRDVSGVIDILDPQGDRVCQITMNWKIGLR